MSLSSQVNALSTGIANYIRDAIRPRLVPAGGVANAHLVKASASDYAMSWSRAASFSTLAVDARPSWAGYTPWDSGNFNPANYAALNGNPVFNTISITQNSTGTSFKLGDDAFMGDVDQANSVGMRGVQDPAQAYWRMGNGGGYFGTDGYNWYIVGTGGQMHYSTGNGQANNKIWHEGSLPPGWIGYNPGVYSTGGTLTNANSTGRYQLHGRTCRVWININIPDKGTSTGIAVYLPFSSLTRPFIPGAEYAVNGRSVAGRGGPGVSSFGISSFDNSNSYLQNGILLILQGEYEIQ